MAEPIVNLPGEVWKPVVEWEGLYEVSNMGRVKTLERVVVDGAGKTQGRVRRFRQRVLSGRVCEPWGHIAVYPKSQGTVVGRYVHRLVLEAFVGPCPEGRECCHNDGNPANNRLENLRWDTKKANAADAIKHGATPRGERNGSAKLTKADVAYILRELEQGANQRILAGRYGVTQSLISQIARKRLWKHVILR